MGRADSDALSPLGPTPAVSGNVPAKTDEEAGRYYVGASLGDVERAHRDGTEVDRLTNWTEDANYGKGELSGLSAPSYHSIDR